MNFFNCKSSSSIQTYHSSSTSLIQFNTKSYSHEIKGTRSQRAVSLEKEFQQDNWIPLNKLKMRRKSCICHQCGDLSKFQYKNMNVPNVPIQRIVQRSISIRKQRLLTASTIIKQSVEKVRKFSGCRLNPTPRSSLSNLRQSTILFSATPIPIIHHQTQINITHNNYQEPLSQISQKLQQITQPKPMNFIQKEKQFVIKINGQPIDQLIEMPQINVLKLPKQSHTKSFPAQHLVARSYLCKQNKGYQTHRQALSMYKSS